VDNLEWTAPVSAIDFLRDVGKHFRVWKMLAKEAVAARLNSEAGISFTEFSYQILQANDFLELHRRHGVHAADRGIRPVGQPHGRHRPGAPHRGRRRPRAVHAAGDQVRRHQVRGSRGRAVWLDPSLTSPYAFFQFWLNADDADARTWLPLSPSAGRGRRGVIAESIERPRHGRRSARWPRS
jgi:tyrosyl-tRNA synthetase